MRRRTNSVSRLLGESTADHASAPKQGKQLDRLLGQLTEGTVIVLNSGSDAAVAPADHTAILQQALAQLKRSSAPQSGPVSVPSNDRLQIEHGGKLWKFKINRDPNGLITDLDVIESA